jgi:hypothetical protein
MRISLADAITANIAAAVAADPRTEKEIALAAWPSVLKSEAAAVLALDQMLLGDRQRPVNIDRLAIGLGVEVDTLTSTRTDAARVWLMDEIARGCMEVSEGEDAARAALETT